jgi:hypothetical protein
MSGSPRSTSSLYHHWNGSIWKKYKSFVTTGKLSECIQWIESGIAKTGAPSQELEKLSSCLGALSLNQPLPPFRPEGDSVHVGLRQLFFSNPTHPRVINFALQPHNHLFK